MRTLYTLMLLAVCATLAACGNQDQAQQQQQQQSAGKQPAATHETAPAGRLPDNVQPLGYDIDFTMDPDKAYFTAHEVLTVSLKQPTDTIWFHGQDIDVQNVKLALANGKTLDIRYKQVNDDGVARLSLPRTVQPQKARIVLDFKNPYSPGLLGAYKVKDNGDNYIFTQFEAIAARRAFPSFDEPAFKTPYTYSFTVPNGDKVVANTPVESKTDAGSGMTKWQFMTTKPLPTYLVAWAVGPLDIVQGPSIPANDLRNRPVPVYGVTVKGKGDLIHYAVQHAGEIVQAEEKYYGIAYPWKKLSLIAVPDFSAGAMENVGAITFRDHLLLMDPETAPTWQKRAYWSVTAHELAHMWTGDLVTVPWWNDIWLNEAFATWMEQKVMVGLHPDWNPKMAILNNRQSAMHADSLVSARAIRQPIKNTGDIKNAFDGITYAKGAAVISMFENYIGPDAFRSGMHNYLEENRYGSASLDDFLAAVSKAAGKNIGPAFKTFLNQPGLPMVEATLKMDNGKPSVHLVQSRYLPLGSSGNREDKHWDIPVCMRYPVDGRATRQCYMLTQNSADVALNGDSLPAWFMPNAEGIGYYQWSLGSAGYGELTQSLDQLTPVGQMSLAGSIEAAFDAGKIDTAQAMKALAPLAHSKHEPVAEEPMSLIRFAREWLVGGKEKDAVEAYARKLYGRYDIAGDFKKGGAPDDANQRAFESEVAGFLADTGRDQQVRKAADAAAMRLLGLGGHGKPDFSAVASDFIPVALTVAVQDKDKPVFDTLEQAFRHAQNPIIRSVTLAAMTSATDPELAARVRALSLDPDAVRQNEAMSIWFGQLGQPETREATWQSFQKNFDRIVGRVSADRMGALPRVAEFFCSDRKAAEVKAFLVPRLAKYPATRRAMRQAMETAHLCAAQRQAQSASARKFFSRP